MTQAPIIKLRLSKPALAVMRYRVVVDERFPAGRLRVHYGGNVIANEIFAQSEDRMLRFVYDLASTKVCFELTDLEENPSLVNSRIRISIFQCIPISI